MSNKEVPENYFRFLSLQQTLSRKTAIVEERCDCVTTALLVVFTLLRNWREIVFQI